MQRGHLHCNVLQLIRVSRQQSILPRCITTSAMPPAPPLRVALLGAGAINGRVAEALGSGEAGAASLAAMLVRTERDERPAYAQTEDEVTLTTDADAFFAADWALCVEAAGQPAVLQHAKRCLGMGRDFMITSIGALCDPALYDDLHATAADSGPRLILCTGSMPAVDWMVHHPVIFLPNFTHFHPFLRLTLGGFWTGCSSACRVRQRNSDADQAAKGVAWHGILDHTNDDFRLKIGDFLMKDSDFLLKMGVIFKFKMME